MFFVQVSNNVKFSACNDLPVLDSSIHWNYHYASNSIDVAFKKNNANPNAWIAWAINPTSTGMVGSQAFVAFRKSDGAITAYTSPVNSYGTRLEEGKLSFQVDAVSASFQKDAIILFATFRLAENSSRVNHVWQEGSVSDNVPLIHALSASNVKSFGQLDFISGKVSDDPHSHNSRILIGRVHGILNGIGWGILMPIGVMLARYLKAFNNVSPMWFHLHRALQILAYFIGTAAQNLPCCILRPNKDHKNRIFWNIFHYIVGYGIMYYRDARSCYLGLVCKRKMKNMEVEDSEKCSVKSEEHKMRRFLRYEISSSV
ncbi:cytochrome b561 and DOMON domain-containing protein [Senna tora]|uniref:Cytochrome b561 and DOMON domain-containing protein n=1 Tax=Senna tora TaxID=362788 RepID=A0A834T8G0_9FABA|nr:cytochrome b561 and DOMON domain-containing protein [Senna tora]